MSAVVTAGAATASDARAATGWRRLARPASGVVTSGAPASGAAAPVPAPPSTSAMTASLGMVSPSETRIFVSVPSKGEGTSALTLSVTTSTRGSPMRTWSPTALSHLPMVPCSTPSPSCGMVTWGMGGLLGRSAGHGGRFASGRGIGLRTTIIAAELRCPARRDAVDQSMRPVGSCDKRTCSSCP